MKHLGGILEREKAVSPPPMPDLALSFITSTDDHVHRTKPCLKKENNMLKQRIRFMEEELTKLHLISADVRRCCSSVYALTTVSLGPVNEELFAEYVISTPV